MALTATTAAAELRCHSCSHGIGFSVVGMRIVGLFRAAAFGAIAPAHIGEIRRRCRTCGWVNVFHPLTQSRADGMVELKLSK
jgi:hypothetical protein